jgi:mono/diheme cytochrome c family protein
MRRVAERAARRSALTGAIGVATLAVSLGAVAGASPPAAGHARQGEAPFDSTMITPAMVNAGRSIFHEKGLCFACHGAHLEGTQIAPTLKAHAWRDAKDGDLAAILGVVSKGVKSTAMVSFPGGISPTEARAVASYVWSVGHGKAKP